MITSQTTMIRTIIRNWLDQGFITRIQQDQAQELLSGFSNIALIGLLLESHISRIENMPVYEPSLSYETRN